MKKIKKSDGHYSKNAYMLVYSLAEAGMQVFSRTQNFNGWSSSCEIAVFLKSHLMQTSIMSKHILHLCLAVKC